MNNERRREVRHTREGRGRGPILTVLCVVHRKALGGSSLFVTVHTAGQDFRLTRETAF